MIRCSKHGLQFAGHFCDHLREAVERATPMTVYVRRGPLAWHVVCSSCLSIGAIQAAENLVCEDCVSSWVVATKNEEYASWRGQARDEPVAGGPFSPKPDARPPSG
jgi:hypothetical protein